MARKKPARPATKKAAKKAKKKAAAKPAARRAIKKTSKKAARKPARPRKAAKKLVKKARPAARKVVQRAVKKAVKKVARKAVPVKTTKPAARAKPAVKARVATAVKKVVLAAKAIKTSVSATITPSRKPNLDRPRKTVADIHGIPSSLGMAGLASAAHSGGEELRDTLKKNNSASPRLTAGDVDADWQSAEATGDESPGGDNPTPDQDVVEEIGRALGVEYADGEELQGGAEITERDTHRWELDPSSKEDFEDEE